MTKVSSGAKKSGMSAFFSLQGSDTDGDETFFGRKEVRAEHEISSQGSDADGDGSCFGRNEVRAENEISFQGSDTDGDERFLGRNKGQDEPFSWKG